MTESIRLGRIRGIRLGANWSVLVVAVLVGVALGERVLPSFQPGLAGVWYAVAACGVTLAFLAGILAHELGHAVVARRQGLEVQGVVIWALGGFTSIDGQPERPGDELALSGIGPLVSLLVGGVLLGVGAGVGALGAPRLAEGSLVWLGGLNLLLAALNALPVSPLDGGRVLHAGLWRLFGDRLRATVVTTAVGQVVGYGALALGMFLLLLGNLEGLWLGATGLFVGAGATAERRQGVLLASVGDRRVGEIMAPVAPTTVPDWWTVELACREGPLAAGWPVAVLHDWHGEPSGLVAGGQLLAVPQSLRHRVRLRELAWPARAVVTTHPEEPVAELLQRWTPETHWAVVLDHGRAVGALSVGDLEALVAGRHPTSRPWASSGPAQQQVGGRGALPVAGGPRR
jgi:Zn-dependent protease